MHLSNGLRSFVPTILGMLLLDGGTLPGKPEAVAKGGPTIRVYLPPGPGNPRNSEGAFVPLKDGRVLFVYTHFTGGGADHAAAHLASRSSGDGGKTWTDEDEVVLPNEGEAERHVGVAAPAAGRRDRPVLPPQERPDDCRLYLRISADEAKTWCAPTLCIADARVLRGEQRPRDPARERPAGGPGRPPQPRPAARAGPGRRRLLPVRRRRQDLAARPDDRAGPPEASRSGLQEPGVVELTDGRLMMLCRTDQGCQYRSYSADGGDTWAPAEPTDIKSPLSPASVEAHPEDRRPAAGLERPRRRRPKLTGASGRRSPSPSRSDEGRRGRRPRCWKTTRTGGTATRRSTSSTGGCCWALRRGRHGRPAEPDPDHLVRPRLAVQIEWPLHTKE